MGCDYTIYLNTYGYSLLFYKVYHEEGECQQLEFWLEKEQIVRHLNITMIPCRGFGATYANGWLIMVGESRTSPVPRNGMRRRHARWRILPSFRALRGDNTPTAALRGLRMITKAKCLQGCSWSCFGL